MTQSIDIDGLILVEEISLKVFDTLAMLLPAKLNASGPEERRYAKAVCAARRLRVALHLAQPRIQSRLWPRAINPADVQQKLRRLVKPIDAHLLVVDNASPAVAWQTRSRKTTVTCPHPNQGDVIRAEAFTPERKPRRQPHAQPDPAPCPKPDRAGR